MSVEKEIQALRVALRRAIKRGVTTKAIAAAGGVRSFSTVYRFMNGNGVALSTVLAIEAARRKLKL